VSCGLVDVVAVEDEGESARMTHYNLALDGCCSDMWKPIFGVVHPGVEAEKSVW
jgi:hypothetical protein